MVSIKNALTLALFLFSSLVFSQNVDFKKQNFSSDPKGFEKALSNYNRGLDYYQRGPRYFEQSLKYLLEANSFNPKNADLNYAIGSIYNALNLKGEAAEYYKKAALLNPKFKKEGLRLAAENLQLDMQSDRAIAEYNDYIAFLESQKTKKNEKETDAEIAEIRQKIVECNNAKQITKDTISIIIINAGKGINTKYPEYSAVVTGDEKTMYFTSRRSNTTGGKIPPGDVFYYEDIYQSSKGADGRWGAARQVRGSINTNDHEGTVAISPDGKKMIIYRHKNSGDLFESTVDDKGNWGSAKSLDGVNSKYRETHASYSPDGNTIYFVSDNPDYGAKGLDIFKASFNEATKKWETPVRLSDEVNTEYDEDGVFVDSDGKYMYFSSKGHNSIGGYDIFRAELVDGQPTNVKNMGYPINTPADEVFFVAMPGGKRAYFNSARKGGYGEKDIYTMLLLQDLELYLTGKFYDKKTNELVKDANVVISKTNHTPEVSYPTSGNYAAQVMAGNKYKAVVNAPGYEELIEYFNSNMTHPDSLNIEKDFYLIPASKFSMKGKVYDEETDNVIPAQLEIVTVMGEESFKVVSGDNGYEAKLTRDAVYKIKITADGYETYEDMLPINEAGEAGLDKDFYLIKVGKKGAAKDVTVKGKVFDKATNQTKNATIVIKDQKDKIVATINATDAGGYSAKLKSNTPYTFSIVSDGYAAVEEKVTLKVAKNNNEALKNFYLEVPVADKVLDLRNIYFDYDKYNVREDGLKDLKAIVKIMNEFPSSKIELSGHTDNIGSYGYNLTLSLNRAKAAYDWLLSNGISKSRIKYTYYSFNKPLAPNKKSDGSDNPEGRQKNRRVEFKVYNVGAQTISGK